MSERARQMCTDRQHCECIRGTWRSSQVIIIKDIQHLRTSLIMVDMDFEALMRNSLLLWVYCVCTNCGDGAHQERHPPTPPLLPTQAFTGCGDGKQEDKIWWKVK